MTDTLVFGGLGRIVIGSNAALASVRRVGPVRDGERIPGVTAPNVGEIGPEVDGEQVPDGAVLDGA